MANQHDALLGTPMASDGERWTNYGPVFFEVGYWKGGEQLEYPVMETEKGVLWEEHPDMLASTCWNQGRWKRRRAAGCGDDKGVLGEEHPDALKSRRRERPSPS